MVELRALGLACVDGSLQAAETVAESAGMTFMTIQDNDGDPAVVRQRFVAFQPVIDLNAPPQALGIYQGVHSPDTVGALHKG